MTNDLTQGRPLKVIAMFTVPMLIGNVFQQLYNMVDSIVVGNYVGSQALAAVGAAFVVNFLILTLAIGLTNGCSVVVSQLFGAGRYVDMQKAVYTSLIFLSGATIVMSAFGYLITPTLLRMLKTPDDIFADSVTYLKIIFIGMIFTVLYNACAAILRAVGDSKTPLSFLILASLINIAGDLLLVVVFDMGVAGVAIATIASQAIAAGLSLLFMFKKMPIFKLTKETAVFEKEMMNNILSYGIPSSAQQLMICLRMLLIQGLVNSYGSLVVAGFTSANKIESFALMPMMNIGMAFTMFVGQNIGMGDLKRVKQGFWDSTKLTVAICLGVSGLIFIFCPYLIDLFLDADAPTSVIAFGVGYLRCVTLFYWMCAVSMVLGGVLRGAGDATSYMYASFASMVVRVASAYILAPYIGFAAIWWSNPIAWSVELVWAYLRYASGKWKGKAIVSAQIVAE